MEVGRNSDGRSLMDFVERSTQGEVVLNTDEWGGYNGVAKSGRGHSTCCHTPGKREWARDDDGVRALLGVQTATTVWNT